MKPWGIFLDDALKLLASIDILSQTPVAPVKIYASLSLSAVQNGRLESVESNIDKENIHSEAGLSHK